MNDLLLYQLPGSKEVICAKGSWLKSDLNLLPEGCFFVTNFDKSSVYYFEIKENCSLLEIDGLVCLENSTVPILSKDDYLFECDRFKADFERFGITKAILSRVKQVGRGWKSLGNVFTDLVSNYGDRAFVYLVSSNHFGTWMGATPEILIRGDERSLESMSLAGTKLSASTVWTNKEKEEQQLVTDFVKEQILLSNPSNFIESPVETVSTGAVYHLCTRFSFSLSQLHWGVLMNSLHPTPAVCGLPRDQALSLIAKHEKHNRGLYTGLIGYKGSERLDVFVNLRCMEVRDTNFLLHIGGGITKRSVPEKEWEETENKANTLVRVLL